MQGSRQLLLPADVKAEEVVIGCAIDSPQAAVYATGLGPADFTKGDHRRLWRASLACPLPYAWEGARTRAIARSAGVPVALAEELRKAAPVLSDSTRSWAGRVRDATLRRRLLAEVAEVHDALAAGASLAEAVVDLERALVVAAGETVGVLAGPESLAS